jgi:prolyl oligopeptidase
MAERARLLMFLLLVLCPTAPAQVAELPPLPGTPQKPVSDDYHGVKVVDPYRWLEDHQSPEVRKWTEQQNKYTRAWLDKFTARKAVLQRLKQLNDVATNEYAKMTYENGKLYAISGDLLVSLRSADEPDSERILVDAPSVLGKRAASIDFFNLSPDGRHIAVSLSADGREDGTVMLFDARTGNKLADAVANVNSPLGGSILWDHEGKGFYYTRNPPRLGDKAREVPQQIFYHEVGKPVSTDTYVFGKELSPIADTILDMSADGKHLLASVTTGWASDQVTHYIKGPDGKWQHLFGGKGRILMVQFGPDDDLLLLSNDDAPRGQVLRVSLKNPRIGEAKVVVPQSEAVIMGFLQTEDRLMVQDHVDGASRIRSFTLGGKDARTLPLPPNTQVKETVLLDGDDLLLLVDSYLSPPAWYRYEAAANKLHRTRLVSTFPAVDFSDTEQVREFAASKDGTRIPLTILRKKDLKKDGKNPVLLTGYGGYRLTLNPEFDPNHRLWIEQGGVYAIAHLRGDGDYGDDWHRAAIAGKRQNAYDDFAACARYLIEEKYTTPQRLAIEGASNGGTLVGVALTQHPKLFRAVIGQVGVYDMLRQEARANGGFDVAEFGTVKDPAQFKALYAYSPYHRVADRTDYPAVFLLTGDNDGRVDPADSRRLAARLQAANSSKLPILFWSSADAGHQLGPDGLSLKADVFAFLFHQLGVEFRWRANRRD